VFENRYDYEVMKRFGIQERLLPEDAIFINRPLSFYEKHRDVLLPAGSVIAILSVIATLLSLNLQKQRTINVTNARLIALDREVITTQRELVSTLGEVIEVRSKETGNHVKRVAKISRLLGEKIGLSNHELEILEAASPMHDVGKIGVPDSILQKPGKLTDAEFDVIKTHTNIGKDILGSSDRELLSIACIIAHQHHERWDGTGYPDGLNGEKISIYARITMLADIYDALSSDRSYKTAWSEERIHDYILSERENFFDPYLVDVFFENIGEVRAIRAQYR
jgi:response regulator RpfG family c-di-GMP phosphodiesterase